MKNIVIIPNLTKDVSLSVTYSVIDELHKCGMQIYVESGVVTSELVNEYSEFPREAELIVVIGGDGSVIDASRYAVEYDIPLIGVNLGKVGYLSEVDPTNIYVLSQIAKGDFFIKEKMLLTVNRVGAEDESVSRFAVNDIVLSEVSRLGVSDFVIEDSLGNSLKYRADGIIFATPQGSTAYSLSAGGPIVAHDVEGILVTAVCPHSFLNRPVMFNASEVIRVTNLSNEPLDISIDGRAFDKIGYNEACDIRRAEKNIKMLQFSKNSMFTGLFRKMRILEDIK